jgi:hypothetical protein
MSTLKGCEGGGWTMVMKIDGNEVSTREKSFLKLSD